ncbi:MAG: adenylyl-sulfate kinase [Nitrospira sp.]|nr:adenylyl-sulfate kinase [Nitrospira sp.]MDH4369861.1 adenylyl-sulfate kinase [Nitrospira sp.]MDH5346435.1 adenylyl-sulfate kinase [Nitrospira sp.]MDH5497269.1 adenylyl-sulfate kinase [Nitrospira sp.]MDH5724416.1 adenylyl-sulfate kinase [Nitrospira sp.]
MTIHAVSPAFAVWLTGLPASGKSTIVAALKPQLEGLGCVVEVLESDAVRRVLTPTPTYSQEERDLLYRALAFMGARLVAHGITVIFDATATKRAYRDFARSLIPKFIEVAVECPLELAMQRDYKGTYQRGQRGESSTVPGLQEPYEAPLNPEVRIETRKLSAKDAAGKVLEVVREKFKADTTPGRFLA